MKKSRLAGLTLLVLSAACYHATIDTGRAPSPQTIEKHWASGWIYGLVPPSVISTAQKCPSGVAKVDTQLSFANQLVSFLTGGIYTPMDIVVTCAQGGTSSLPVVQSEGDKVAAIEEAALLSQKENSPVLVKY